MSDFGDYSLYYDAFYRDKDYAGEAQFVHGILKKYAARTQSILDLGCGTGAHAEHLYRLDYRIHGVDQSEIMLAQARQRLESMPAEAAGKISFSQGDIRRFRSAERYDAVVALFHVMSYQTKNDDLISTFETARYHMPPGGIFIFDCWYGPAVLTDRPQVRVKHFEDEALLVTRTAEPIVQPNENVVDVNYRIIVRNKRIGTIQEFSETHSMRYLFAPEISLIAQASGFELLSSLSWMDERPLGFDSWYACFVCRTK